MFSSKLPGGGHAPQRPRHRRHQRHRPHRRRTLPRRRRRCRHHRPPRHLSRASRRTRRGRRGLYRRGRTGVVCDATDPRAVEALAARFETLDVLVNAAGGLGAAQPGPDATELEAALAQWRADLDGDLLSAVLTTPPSSRSWLPAAPCSPSAPSAPNAAAAPTALPRPPWPPGTRCCRPSSAARRHRQRDRARIHRRHRLLPGRHDRHARAGPDRRDARPSGPACRTTSPRRPSSWPRPGRGRSPVRPST